MAASLLESSPDIQVPPSANSLPFVNPLGMTRRQLRRSIRWEAAIMAVFGALLGGVVFGVAATLALPDAFVNDVRITRPPRPSQPRPGWWPNERPRRHHLRIAMSGQRILPRARRQAMAAAGCSCRRGLSALGTIVRAALSVTP